MTTYRYPAEPRDEEDEVKERRPKRPPALRGLLSAEERQIVLTIREDVARRLKRQGSSDELEAQLRHLDSELAADREAISQSRGRR